MFDTNILISISIFPNERMNRIVEFIVKYHTLVLSDLVIEEFLEVAAYEKFDKVTEAKAFLKKLSYKTFKTPKISKLKNVSIRDEEDYDILFSAIKSKSDIFITGDKDFLECNVLKPRMLTIYEFENEYMK